MGNKMLTSKLKWLQICLLATSFCIAQVASANVVGAVIFKTGDVSITHADNFVAQAEKNAALNSGDTLETREGRLQFSLIDGGKVSLQPNSIFKINKYEFSGKEDGSEFAFTELIKGGLRTISGLIGHKHRERYQLKTTVATVGIRGTEFTVNFNNNQFLMTTNHGSVDVCGAGGNCLNAATGQSIAVDGLGGAPKYSSKAATASAASPKSANAETKSDSNSDSSATASTDSSSTASSTTTSSNSTAATIVASTNSRASSNLGSGSSSGPVALVTGSVNSTGIPSVVAAGLPVSGTIVSLAAESCGCVTSEVFDANLTIDVAGQLSVATNSKGPNRDIQPLNFTSFNTDGIVSWGQAQGGTYVGNGSTNFTMAMYDYIAGATPDNKSLAKATGTYNVFGSTAPFLINGGTFSSAGVANAVSGYFTFNFNSGGSYGYNLSIPTNIVGVSDTFNLKSSNTVTSSDVRGLNASNPSFSNNSNICSASSTCSGSIQGSFLGAAGQRIGLQYNISAAAGNIYGGAVLK